MRKEFEEYLLELVDHLEDDTLYEINHNIDEGVEGRKVMHITYEVIKCITNTIKTHIDYEVNMKKQQKKLLNKMNLINV